MPQGPSLRGEEKSSSATFDQDFHTDQTTAISSTLMPGTQREHQIADLKDEWKQL